LIRVAVANSLARRALRKLGHTGALPAWFWRQLPCDGTVPVEVPRGRKFHYRCIGHDAIGRQLFWKGLPRFEWETVHVFCELARTARLVLDVGANTGVYSLMACAVNPQASVVAFEPVPDVCGRLVANLELNGWSERCRVVREAVAASVGTAELHVPFGDVPTSASLHRDGFRGCRGGLLRVPVTTVDAACGEAAPVDLVKIDVEGFEHEVLQGMRRTMARCAPAIILECNPGGPVEQLQAILAATPYRVFALRKGGPVRVPRIVPDPRERHRNFLLTVHEDWRGRARLLPSRSGVPEAAPPERRPPGGET
jgi:FkbM family methyltransferase